MKLENLLCENCRGHSHRHNRPIGSLSWLGTRQWELRLGMPGCHTEMDILYISPYLYSMPHSETRHRGPDFQVSCKMFPRQQTNSPQTNSNVLAQPQQWRRQRKVLRAQMQPEKSPTSADAATEWHASAERNNEDLTTTKALTRGTEDVDNGNVGRTEDPCTSFEASVKGISAKCSETTPVVLEGVLHEMRNEPQDLLQATPRRLPVEGKLSECKQEVADNVVTAGRTNGTAGTAKPIIADVNRTATLGKDLVTAACGVDEGDEMERNELRLQQTNLFCEKVDQRNGNATEDVPSIHGVPLEGEWTVYLSGKASDSRSNAKAFNAAIEHADGLGESTETANTKEVESKGCSGGMDK